MYKCYFNDIKRYFCNEYIKVDSFRADLITENYFYVKLYLPIFRTGVWVMSCATNWLHSMTASVLLASD